MNLNDRLKKCPEFLKREDEKANNAAIEAQELADKEPTPKNLENAKDLKVVAKNKRSEYIIYGAVEEKVPYAGEIWRQKEKRSGRKFWQ